MDLVKLCPKKMLEEITMKLGIMPPIYGLELHDDHLFRIYVYINFEHGWELEDEPFEYFKIWGQTICTQIQSEQIAAEFAINELKCYFHFEVEDINFLDKKYYKYLYEVGNRAHDGL